MGPPAVPAREEIRLTLLSHQVWPAFVLAAVAGWAGLATPGSPNFHLLVPAGLALLYAARRLTTPYLMLGRRILAVRSPVGIFLVSSADSKRPFLEAGDDPPEEGTWIRLADLASAEVRGSGVKLTWWHRAKSRTISLQGLRAADRERVLAWLREGVGSGRGAAPRGPVPEAG